MKILSPKIHGVIDYLVVALFALAPTLFGFTGAPRIASYVLAGVHLTMTLFTAFPLGVVKAIPFTVHGGMEAVMAPLLIALPWIVGFSDVPAARNFFIASGVAIAAVWLLTNYKAADSSKNVFHTRPSHA